MLKNLPVPVSEYFGTSYTVASCSLFEKREEREIELLICHSRVIFYVMLGLCY